MEGLDPVLPYVRPLAVCVLVAGTCLGVRAPTPLAVILAKSWALAFGASELIASDLISIHLHGEYSPRDLSIRVKGLASVRVHEPATPVAAIIVLVWATWMAVVVRDLSRAATLLDRDDFWELCWERARATAREEARAPARHQRTDEEVKEVVARMALARSFDFLRICVQGAPRAARAACPARGRPGAGKSPYGSQD